MKKILAFRLSIVAPYLVFILGAFSYLWDYSKPNNLYWDENYYLTAVEKYKKRVFFQESHPPLGKLVMLAGERLMDPNRGIDNDFEKTDFARNVPPGYSFGGVRFFPALFGWLNCILFFILLMTLTGSPTWSLALSFLYTLDNALIVHSRGAMLDPIQLFGILMALIAYFRIYRPGKTPLDGAFKRNWAIVLGLAIAWTTWTKLNGLIVIALLPAMIFYLRAVPWRLKFRKLLPAWGWAAGAMVVLTLLTFQIHFSLGRYIRPELNNNGWYRASEALREIKENPDDHRNFVRNFYIEFRDYMNFVSRYADGVPRLNLCKKGENGSPFYWWPFGARTINYRWETKNQGMTTSYLYLVPNPFVWGLALLAVLCTFAFFIAKLTVGVSLDKRDEQHLLVLFLLYLGYMVTIARIDRVMYTYHYFIPLIISFAMVAKWMPQIARRLDFSRLKRLPDLHIHREAVVQVFIMIGCAAGWSYMYPLTYYKPISCAQFQSRMLLSGWQMKPVQCKGFQDNSIYAPVSANPPTPALPTLPPVTQTPTTLPGKGARSAQAKSASLKDVKNSKNQPRTTNSLPSKPQK